MGLTERHWEIYWDIIDDAHEIFGTAQDLRGELNAFLRSFKPHALSRTGIDSEPCLPSSARIWKFVGKLEPMNY